MQTIVHFDVPAEDIESAKKFYSALIGWKFESFPEMQYNLITTTNLDGTPEVGSGMGKRMEPSKAYDDLFWCALQRCCDETGQKPRWKPPHGKDGSAPEGLPCQLR
jgi:predicted enzyme related to lactoylglutathione lyase